MQVQEIVIVLLDIFPKVSQASAQNVIPAAANVMGSPRTIVFHAGVTQLLHRQMNANVILDFSMILDCLSVYLVIQTA